MSDALPSLRTPAEQTAYAAMLDDLAGRDRGDEAVMVFREPTDPDAAVIADAMIRTGSVSDALYARLLAAADRLYAPPAVARAIAFECVRHSGPYRPQAASVRATKLAGP